ncbi:MAG: hypothetical protein PHV82_02520 [Victivallaceae bacterium]|nr:hypothetical protein [Victivallaceae bacterium]
MRTKFATCITGVGGLVFQACCAAGNVAPDSENLVSAFVANVRKGTSKDVGVTPDMRAEIGRLRAVFIHKKGYFPAEIYYDSKNDGNFNREPNLCLKPDLKIDGVSVCSDKIPETDFNIVAITPAVILIRVNSRITVGGKNNGTLCRTYCLHADGEMYCNYSASFAVCPQSVSLELDKSTYGILNRNQEFVLFGKGSRKIGVYWDKKFTGQLATVDDTLADRIRFVCKKSKNISLNFVLSPGVGPGSEKNVRERTYQYRHPLTPGTNGSFLGYDPGTGIYEFRPAREKTEIAFPPDGQTRNITVRIKDFEKSAAVVISGPDGESVQPGLLKTEDDFSCLFSWTSVPGKSAVFAVSQDTAGIYLAYCGNNMYKLYKSGNPEYFMRINFMDSPYFAQFSQAQHPLSFNLKKYNSSASAVIQAFLTCPNFNYGFLPQYYIEYPEKVVIRRNAPDKIGFYVRATDFSRSLRSESDMTVPVQKLSDQVRVDLNNKLTVLKKYGSGRGFEYENIMPCTLTRYSGGIYDRVSFVNADGTFTAYESSTEQVNCYDFNPFHDGYPQGNFFGGKFILYSDYQCSSPELQRGNILILDKVQDPPKDYQAEIGICHSVNDTHYLIKTDKPNTPGTVYEGRLSIYVFGDNSLSYKDFSFLSEADYGSNVDFTGDKCGFTLRKEKGEFRCIKNPANVFAVRDSQGNRIETFKCDNNSLYIWHPGKINVIYGNPGHYRQFLQSDGTLSAKIGIPGDVSYIVCDGHSYPLDICSDLPSGAEFIKNADGFTYICGKKHFRFIETAKAVPYDEKGKYLSPCSQESFRNTPDILSIETPEGRPVRKFVCTGKGIYIWNDGPIKVRKGKPECYVQYWRLSDGTVSPRIGIPEDKIIVRNDYGESILTKIVLPDKWTGKKTPVIYWPAYPAVWEPDQVHIYDVSNPDKIEMVPYTYIRWGKGIEFRAEKSHKYEIFGHQPYPCPPQLVSPVGNIEVFRSDPPLYWNIPKDYNNDKLHFKLVISASSDFAGPIVYESKNDPAGFVQGYIEKGRTGVNGMLFMRPHCTYWSQEERGFPIPREGAYQGLGVMSFTKLKLNPGTYWWRVAAWDGRGYGEFSKPGKFIVKAGEKVEKEKK